MRRGEPRLAVRSFGRTPDRGTHGGGEVGDTGIIANEDSRLTQPAWRVSIEIYRCGRSVGQGFFGPQSQWTGMDSASVAAAVRITASARAWPGCWQTDESRRSFEGRRHTISGKREASRGAQLNEPAGCNNRPRVFRRPAERAETGTEGSESSTSSRNSGRFAPYHEMIESKLRSRSTTSSRRQDSQPVEASRNNGLRPIGKARQRIHSAPRTRLRYTRSAAPPWPAGSR